jgi:hypothetical protein
MRYISVLRLNCCSIPESLWTFSYVVRPTRVDKTRSLGVKYWFVSARNKIFLLGNPEKSCQKIIGFDANALYLYCMDQPMPTGPFIQRRMEDGFHPKKHDRYTLMFDWMNFLNHSHGCSSLMSRVSIVWCFFFFMIAEGLETPPSIISFSSKRWYFSYGKSILFP